MSITRAISLRDSWENRYPALRLNQGVRAFHPFYTIAPEAFPYKSLRTLLRSLDWPAPAVSGQLIPKPDYPADMNTGWSQIIQGLTHDRDYWYFSQQYGLWKFPLEFDLSSAPADERIRSVRIPGDLSDRGYNHFGDIDYYHGRIYVSLEGEAAGCPVMVLAYPADMEGEPVYLPLGKTPEVDGRQSTSAPWCAINPLNGLLYSSSYNTKELCVYQLDLVSPIETERVKFLGTFKLLDKDGNEFKEPIAKIQGGVFSAETGHLYLVSNVPDGGIMGFDMSTGRRLAATQIDYQPFMDVPIPKTPDSGWDWAGAIVTGGVNIIVDNIIGGKATKRFQWEELEGITLWEADHSRAPGISGQLHIVMNRPNATWEQLLTYLTNPGKLWELIRSGDIPTRMYFKHYGVLNAEDKTKL